MAVGRKWASSTPKPNLVNHTIANRGQCFPDKFFTEMGPQTSAVSKNVIPCSKAAR